MQTKGHSLNALPKSGEIILLAVAVDKQLRPKRIGGSYLNVRLADRTGELEAKVWQHPEEMAAQFECGQVVKGRGSIEEFNGHPQLIINGIRQQSRAVAEQIRR